MKECLNPKCNNKTKNPKYCSKSCAASYNNILYPRRRTKKKCIVCGEKAKSYKQYRFRVFFN